MNVQHLKKETVQASRETIGLIGNRTYWRPLVVLVLCTVAATVALMMFLKPAQPTMVHRVDFYGGTHRVLVTPAFMETTIDEKAKILGPIRNSLRDDDNKVPAVIVVSDCRTGQKLATFSKDYGWMFDGPR